MSYLLEARVPRKEGGGSRCSLHLPEISREKRAWGRRRRKDNPPRRGGSSAKKKRLDRGALFEGAPL